MDKKFVIVNRHPKTGKVMWAVSNVKADGTFTHCGAPFKQMKRWSSLQGVKIAFGRMLDGPDKNSAVVFEMIEIT